MAARSQQSWSSLCFGSVLFLLLATCLISPATSEIKSFRQLSPSNTIIPIDEFGFTANGTVELNVSEISYSSTNPSLNFSRLVFFLATRKTWLSAIQENDDGRSLCPIKLDAFDTVFTLTNKTGNSFATVHSVKKPGLYTLVFANCLRVEVSMEIVSSMYNIDPVTGARDYLSTGEEYLPKIYPLFFLVYSILSVVWAVVLYKKKLTAFRIHYLMLALVILKTVTLLFEEEDKSIIWRTGSAHGWDVPFYIFSVLKGITLFIVIILIGSGWSFLKPYLQDREKKLLMIVVPLQVFANIAQVILDGGLYSSGDYLIWKQVFLLVDITCCCAVLFPIVWSIKKLKEAAHVDGKAAVNLMKLSLFRRYYIVVIIYIYFTRIGVYALGIITSYRYAWTTDFTRELATLAFFVFTGYIFRPVAHNIYFMVDDEDEEAAVEALKIDRDDFEL